MRDSWTRKPPLRDGVHPFPVHSVSLAATPKGVQPGADDLGSEGTESRNVGRHGVVREIASRDVAEPATLFGQGLMPRGRSLLDNLHASGGEPHPAIVGVVRARSGA